MTTIWCLSLFLANAKYLDELLRDFSGVVLFLSAVPAAPGRVAVPQGL